MQWWKYWNSSINGKVKKNRIHCIHKIDLLYRRHHLCSYRFRILLMMYNSNQVPLRHFIAHLISFNDEKASNGISKFNNFQ